MRVYELNTAVWLAGRTFAKADWSSLPADIDAVWLMGVWERSPAGLEIARGNAGLMADFRAAVPDLRDEDIIGSPYCVRRYEVDPRFGDLADARAALTERGLRLILDYVPNHVAPDHPWVVERPGCFVHGSEEDLARDPASYLRVGDQIVARGRDPYFPAWPDVVQLNAFSPDLRSSVSDLLVELAGLCDGVRCDMAMLMCNEVFARTWGLEPPAEEFWPGLIARVKAAHPGFTFIAEAYWDMEYTLQQQGFDLCYDKRLYDRLEHEDAASVRGHLSGDPAFERGLIRFIENHDEPRAATVFGVEKSRAAAVVISTVPGARLYHDGQFEGYRTKIPVFLSRGPDEAPDAELRGFYSRLLAAAGDLAGEWRLCDAEPASLVAWAWEQHLIVVNLSAMETWGVVHTPWSGPVTYSDRLSGAVYERDGAELYVILPPWGAHFLARG